MDFSGLVYTDKYNYLLRLSNEYRTVLGIKGDEQTKRRYPCP